MQSIIGDKIPILRAMPNTATGVSESLTCICANDENASLHLEEIKSLFEKIGETVVIKEDLMDGATVLGACGIAYVMRFIRAMVQGGIEIGFDAKTASFIANQTVKGAAQLLILGNTHPEQEIDKVTTPRGCTIAGLNEMEHQGFSSSLIKGIITSFKKIEETKK
jgi:pyrroline-5-carboxylate reductase